MRKFFFKLKHFFNLILNKIDYLNYLFEVNFLNKFKIFKRLTRFLITWTGLSLIIFVVLVFEIFNLNNAYQLLKFQPGGLLSLGFDGIYTGSNPLFVRSTVDSDVSKLIYAGLFTYNQKNQLVGDLAQNYQIKDNGKDYIVHLRPHLFFSSGVPLTAQDVVFTYNLIENPDVQSPLESSFNGVKVIALNASTVEFKLSNQLSSFIYSLTNGIVPEYLLKNIPPIDLRSIPFSTIKPIGAGPYEWQSINFEGDSPSNSQAEISLIPNPNYFLGQAKIKQILIKTYPNQQLLKQAFKNNKIDAAVNLNLENTKNLYQVNYLFSAGTYLFFKTSISPFNNQKIRQALERAINVPGLIKKLQFPTHQVFGPLLVGQLAYQAKYNEASYNPSQAVQILQSIGYKYNQNHQLVLNNQPLSFSITLVNNPLNHLIFQSIKNNLNSIGVNVLPVFENINQFALSLEYHQYESLINSISIGLDPDVYAYWDGSQANSQLLNSLNFSEYNNSSASRSLATARITLNTEVRIIKYAHFQADWSQDVPAVGLFQPNYVIVSHQPIKNLIGHEINSSSGIFNNVNDWEINRVRMTQ